MRAFCFTTAAMAAALEDTLVSYEDLAEIEKEFDQVETEIIRQQVNLTAPLYARRTTTVAQIPNFWPLVLEQAPPDIDQYIQPSDSVLLLSALTGLAVRHFELEDPAAAGDPRSVAIVWTFSANKYFTDTVLEKRFWWRRSRAGWCGLVSEPVRIRWKKGKDLTGGLLDLVCNAWEAEQAQAQARAPGLRAMSAEQKALKQKIDQTGMGGLSFFAWFGFIGPHVSAAESDEATQREAERRERRRQGPRAGSPAALGDDEDGETGDGARGLESVLEIFPDGDDLAVAITEDLWPGAIKYFIQAQEQDALSDADFESDDDEHGHEDAEGEEDEEEVEEVDDEEEEKESDPDADRPAKKRRS